MTDKASEGRYAIIYIEDRGLGINPEIRDHAFEPFTSTKQTVGVGMGLTITRPCGTSAAKSASPTAPVAVPSARSAILSSDGCADQRRPCRRSS